MRNICLLLGYLTGLLFCGVRNTAAEAASPGPNVIVIFCDDLGYGDLGCFGSEGASYAGVGPDGG